MILLLTDTCVDLFYWLSVSPDPAWSMHDIFNLKRVIEIAKDLSLIWGLQLSVLLCCYD